MTKFDPWSAVYQALLCSNTIKNITKQNKTTHTHIQTHKQTTQYLPSSHLSKHSVPAGQVSEITKVLELDYLPMSMSPSLSEVTPNLILPVKFYWTQILGLLSFSILIEGVIG